jgi:hypothetical protein
MRQMSNPSLNRHKDNRTVRDRITEMDLQILKPELKDQEAKGRANNQSTSSHHEAIRTVRDRIMRTDP